MYNEDGMIKAVELAPNGVVRSVYPQASNADALELNMLRHPERKVEASLAKESGQYTIAELEKAARGGAGHPHFARCPVHRAHHRHDGQRL